MNAIISVNDLSKTFATAFDRTKVVLAFKQLVGELELILVEKL